MTELEYYKYRCQECKEELAHFVYHKGKVIDVPGCKCKGARKFDLVPLTKRAFLERFK